MDDYILYARCGRRLDLLSMTKKTLTVAFAVAFGTFVAFLATPSYITYEQPIISNADEKKHVLIEVAEAKEKDSFDLWMDELSRFECEGCGPQFRVLDTNGKYSYGCLQYQEATFNGFAEQYGIEGDIYDCSVQKALTRALWEDPTYTTQQKANHWKTSIFTRGLGLPPGYSL